MDRHKKEDNGNNTLHLQVNVGSKMIKASRQKQGGGATKMEVSHGKEIISFGGGVDHVLGHFYSLRRKQKFRDWLRQNGNFW